MKFQLLSELAEELGYPRNNFLDLNRAGNNVAISYYSKEVENLLQSEFYLVEILYKDNSKGYTLVRFKDKMLSSITDMINVHLYNAIIKNILLGNYEKELTNNILLYILYYRVVYKSYNPLTNAEITDGVILELCNIIKLLIDKEFSTYKNEPRISDIIAELRKLLIRERIHKGIKPKLNLRR